MNDRERSAQIVRHCIPIYIGGKYLQDGHSAATTSATGTFIRFKGVDYAVTCGHVSQEAYATERSTARMHLGRSVIQFDSFEDVGSIRSLRDVGGESSVDISICRLGPNYVEDMSRRNGLRKAPIDLSACPEINWTNAKWALAAGFPDRAKSESDGLVSAPMVEVIAEIVSRIGCNEKFALHAACASPYGLSGMSGGPIFLINEDGTISPIGIIFEGNPSIINVQRPCDAFLRNDEVLILGQLLTPVVFEKWLKDAGLGHK